MYLLIKDVLPTLLLPKNIILHTLAPKRFIDGV